MQAEADLDELIATQRFPQAATLALRVYGAELFGFLVGYMGEEADAAEVFAQFSEDLWRGLPAFARRCTLRTWMYQLARNAAFRYRRSPWNRGGKTGDRELDEVIAQVRTETPPWRRTDMKDKLRELRDSLELDDRALLILRVDRDLPWSDVARVMLGRDEATDAELDREAARLRKRFQSLKDDLRLRAREAGLLEQ